jgi:hypothetical protein
MATTLTKIVIGLMISVTMGVLAARAETASFDRDPAGGSPAGWNCGSTDGGAPRWEVEADKEAPSAPNVLVQSGSGSYPWCVKEGTSLANGVVEVKFKPLAGVDDQAGGVVWRWKDSDTYYVALADALDDEITLSYVEGGRMRIVRTAKAPMSANSWHKLRVEFDGTRIRVMLDGTSYIETDHSRIKGAGAVGIWTKADSVTAFDDFTYQSSP